MDSQAMKTTVGVFMSRPEAERAISRLREDGLSDRSLNLLTPASSREDLESVPTTDAEQPGIEKAIGGVIGGAVGASGGFAAFATASSVIPGAGPILGMGVVASALLGAGGAAAGATAAGELDRRLSDGLPRDELFVYEDALKKGRSVVIVVTDRSDRRRRSLELMTEAGAESLDAARDNWWLGLRDAERESYEGDGGDFSLDEPDYRLGFEAAAEGRARGELARLHPRVHERPAFRRGYERGRAWSGRPGD